MRRIKLAAVATIGVLALSCLSSAPALAGGPLLFAPWALGHLLRAATLPLAVAAAAVNASAGYDGGYRAPQYYGPNYGPPYYAQPPVYSAPPASYAPPVTYYAPPPAYYPAPAYYGPPVGYAAPYARYYAPRYDAAPRLRYPGAHGAQGWYGSPGYYHRHR